MKQIGREVAIQEVIDPDIMGGVRVELGDEVFEGTVVDRLEAARRLFG
jgi:F-type H+-transporting ATPase subunit delta